MHTLRLTVSLMFAGAFGHASAQYAALQPVIAAAQPEILRQGPDSTLVQFGPVKAAFPPGWRFFAGSVGSEALSPAGVSTSVMVLVGQFAQVPGPAAGITQALNTYFCGTGSSAHVDQLPQRSDRSVFVGQCVGKEGPQSYVLFYEVRSSGRMVQLISTGTGQVGLPRRELDAVALSLAFE